MNVGLGEQCQNVKLGRRLGLYLPFAFFCENNMDAIVFHLQLKSN